MARAPANRRNQTGAAKTDPKAENAQGWPPADPAAFNAAVDAHLAEKEKAAHAARAKRKPAPGDMVIACPSAITDEAVPLLVTHVEDDGSVSGTAFSAYPHRIGHNKPVLDYTRLPQGTGPGTWRWPG